MCSGQRIWQTGEWTCRQAGLQASRGLRSHRKMQRPHIHTVQTLGKAHSSAHGHGSKASECPRVRAQNLLRETGVCMQQLRVNRMRYCKQSMEWLQICLAPISLAVSLAAHGSALIVDRPFAPRVRAGALVACPAVSTVLCYIFC